MRLQTIALAIAAIAVCGVTQSGCGRSNEADLKGESKVAPPKADMPNFNNFIEFQQYNMQKAKEQMKKGHK
jgi:hypothetical protein